MTATSRWRSTARALARRVDAYRHLLAGSLISVLLTLGPSASLDLERPVARDVMPASAATHFEMTARLCIAGSGCGSVSARIIPR
jgi:hypothetical protein